MPRTATTTWTAQRISLCPSSLGRCGGHVVVACALVWLLRLPVGLMVGALVGIGVVLVVWRVGGRRSFARFVIRPVLGAYWRQRIHRCWPEVAHSCELAPAEAPRIVRCRAGGPRVRLVVRPLFGQTFEDFEKAAEAIRTAYGASQIRVDPDGVRDVAITFTIGDVLALPFEARVPDLEPSLTTVPMGRRSDGEQWWLAVGPHTLVAGSSGAGKGSVFWSFVFALAPAVHDGRVQLHGIDLKGGMEILMGEGLFSTQATTAGEAVAVLEQLVEWMRERTAKYAGQLRSHLATPEEPLHVVMIDELAALTAYCPERELHRRAELAINLLCSQGRAPGFVVFACLQDPRKEVIPSRGLFTQMIGLRLKDLSETSMVLGEVAVNSGAYCHRITRDVPGTGYVIPEEGGHPIKVRAGYASDDAIRQVAAVYAAPVRLEIPAIEPDTGYGTTRQRRPRSGEVV